MNRTIWDQMTDYIIKTYFMHPSYYTVHKKSRGGEEEEQGERVGKRGEGGGEKRREKRDRGRTYPICKIYYL